MLFCICCGTNVARLEGINTADLDKVIRVTVMDAIEEVHRFTGALALDVTNGLVEAVTGATDIFGYFWSGSTAGEGC